MRPGSWADFIALALPELRAQGILAPARAQDASPVTLRERIYPGHKRALDSHRASQFRKLQD
ncbi:hypothetical protein [Duganella radicis]|uniref:Uncharacterized protein n=1 Tax=Duganella radicis TaxID=551988 RepID=A0A6L6PGK3_9BURK|nr:hypothetical protein [Duganella radicis]MTV37707.1 hypothetical protein [Duganella radicis]